MVCTPSERFELPRSRKIIKADAYASALRMRVCARGSDFVLHHMAHRVQQTNEHSVSQNWAQLGLVVPKRLAKQSVRRNLLKRLIRESFRMRANQLPAGLWVVRLNSNISKAIITARQKKLWAEQLSDLWAAGNGFSEQLRLGKVVAAVRHSQSEINI
jgi:ribonuclease P protein component